jgi:hypothetical protein
LATDITTLSSQLARETPSFVSNTTAVANTAFSTSGWNISATVGTTNAYLAFSSGNMFQEGVTLDSNGNVQGGWYLNITFPVSNITLSGFSYDAPSSLTNQNITRWGIQRSTDNVNWEEVQQYTVNGGFIAGQTYHYSIVNAHAEAQYWRMRVYKMGAVGNPVRISKFRLKTTGLQGSPRLSSVVNQDFNTFRIILVDVNNAPLSVVATPIQWQFNIMITKGGKLVAAGLFRITYLASLNSALIERITPTPATISEMSTLG